MTFELDHDYHVIELTRDLPQEHKDWLQKTLGPSGPTTWKIVYKKVYFYNQLDHMMFLLRIS